MKTNKLKTKGNIIAMVLMAILASWGTAPSFAAISVVATVPELAEITRYIGGDNVTVYSIAKPNRDYHAVEARPSDVQRVARAKMIVTSGMDLESWMTALLNAAGNKNLHRGGSGY